MIRFLALKARQIIPVVFLVTFLTTLLAGLIPGSPAYAIYGEVPLAFAAKWNRQHGLDFSIWVQYWHWIYHAFHGDLGSSWASSGSQTVLYLLRQHIPVTAEIAVSALVVSLSIAIPLAMFAAARPNSLIDRAVTLGSSILHSLASFVTALFLVAIFSVDLHWLPSQGWTSFNANASVNVKDVILPVLTLVLSITPTFVRVLRGDLVSYLNADFAVSARSRGIPEWYVMVRHVLRPASTSLLTVAGISLGYLVAGSIIVETFYNLPGIGALAIYAVDYKDIPVLQGIVVFVALFFIVINTLVDLAYRLIDPRVELA